MFAKVIEKRREALQRLPWLRPVLLGINVILAVVGVFLIPVVDLIIGLGLIAMNELLTPVIFQRIFIKEFEGTLSTPGDLQRRHFRPLPVTEEVLAKHKQRSRYSCIPMSVEFVLKLLGKLPPDDFSLQDAWGDGRYGNFSDFDGQTINGVKFRKQFPQPRDDSALISTTSTSLLLTNSLKPAPVHQIRSFLNFLFSRPATLPQVR